MDIDIDIDIDIYRYMDIDIYKYICRRMYTQKKNYILQLKVSRFHDHQAILVFGVLPDDRENVKLLVAKCSFSSVYTSYVLLYFTY